MTINVTAVNDVPTTSNGTVSTNEDTAYTFEAGDFGFADVDPGDALASVKITRLPTSGTGTLALDGTTVTQDLVVTKAHLDANNLVYTPPANANGDGYADFEFTVSDGTAESASATTTIDVIPVNDAASGRPVITGTTRVGETLTAGKGDIADVDGLPATFPGRLFIPVDPGGRRLPHRHSDRHRRDSYTLTDDDEGKKLKVEVSFTDEDGTDESLTSAEQHCGAGAAGGADHRCG